MPDLDDVFEQGREPKELPHSLREATNVARLDVYLEAMGKIQDCQRMMAEDAAKPKVEVAQTPDDVRQASARGFQDLMRGLKGLS